MERTNKDKISHCSVVSCSPFLNIFSVEEQNDYGRSHVWLSIENIVKDSSIPTVRKRLDLLISTILRRIIPACYLAPLTAKYLMHLSTLWSSSHQLMMSVPRNCQNMTGLRSKISLTYNTDALYKKGQSRLIRKASSGMPRRPTAGGRRQKNKHSISHGRCLPAHTWSSFSDTLLHPRCTKEHYGRLHHHRCSQTHEAVYICTVFPFSVNSRCCF